MKLFVQLLEKYFLQIGRLFPQMHCYLLWNNTGVETLVREVKESRKKFRGLEVNTKWDSKMVNRILMNRVYTGTLEQGKHTKINYKSQFSVAVNPEGLDSSCRYS